MIYHRYTYSSLSCWPLLYQYVVSLLRFYASYLVELAENRTHRFYCLSMNDIINKVYTLYLIQNCCCYCFSISNTYITNLCLELKLQYHMSSFGVRFCKTPYEGVSFWIAGIVIFIIINVSTGSCVLYILSIL